MIQVKDSKGNGSKTLLFTYIAFVIGTIAFVYTTILSGTADLLAYGGFVTTTLLPWLGREYIQKQKEPEEDVQ